MIDDRISAVPAKLAAYAGVPQRPAVQRVSEPQPPTRAWRQAVLDQVPQMLFVANDEGQIDYHNDHCRAFLGITRDVKAHHWTRLVHPADLCAVLDLWQHCQSERIVFDKEFRVRRHDGSYRWVACRITPDRMAPGWIGSFTDIDDLKRGFDKANLIAGELSHRVQNVFAVVGAVLMLSARTEPQAQAFADAARARLCSLARAHTLVSPGGSPVSSTSLHQLLGTLLAPYQPGIEISGHDITMFGDAAISLALLIHELASNAVKHGALSVAGGSIHIASHNSHGELRLVWHESGGPAVTQPPSRRGFGSTLFERALPTLAGSRFDRRWAPDGLIATLIIPLSALQA